MYDNLQDEYATTLEIPFASRNATFQSPALDLQDTNPKKRRVWFTILAGAVNGQHFVELEHENQGGNFVLAEQVAVTGPGLFGPFQHRRVKRRIRLVHNVVNAGQAAEVGVIVSVPRDPKLSLLGGGSVPGMDVEEALRHCTFALGIGAQMFIEGAALEELAVVVRQSFEDTLRRENNPNDPPGNPGRERWFLVRNFLLSCCELIGRKAAENARNANSVAIRVGHLRSAYNVVRNANVGGGGAGDYCPNW